MYLNKKKTHKTECFKMLEDFKNKRKKKNMKIEIEIETTAPLQFHCSMHWLAKLCSPCVFMTFFDIDDSQQRRRQRQLRLIMW